MSDDDTENESVGNIANESVGENVVTDTDKDPDKDPDTDKDKDTDTDKDKDKDTFVNMKKNQNNLEKIEPLEIKEITDADLEINNSENIKLKKPNDIYYEIYCAAKEKARTARKLAFDAYLEVKKIKKIYMLDDSDSDFSNSDNEEDSENEEGSDNEEASENKNENE
jgi:hypothetical protein